MQLGQVIVQRTGPVTPGIAKALIDTMTDEAVEVPHLEVIGGIEEASTTNHIILP